VRRELADGSAKHGVRVATRPIAVLLPTLEVEVVGNEAQSHQRVVGDRASLGRLAHGVDHRGIAAPPDRPPNKKHAPLASPPLNLRREMKWLKLVRPVNLGIPRKR
jgi:hypothetical protein